MGDLQRLLRKKEQEAAAAEARLQALAEQHAAVAGAKETARRGCGELQGRQEELRQRAAAAALER